MNREATESGEIRERPRRLRAPRGALAACSIHFAGLVALAHLLVAAHTIAHLYPPSVDSTSQHCAICSIGKHPTGIPEAVAAASEYTATWITWCASPPELTPRCLAGVAFARAPPLSSSLVATG